MQAFRKQGTKLKKVSQKEFKDELELHSLIDANLQEIFGIRYIKDEHITDKHGRIETIGLDESNRPVVIEYKKSKERGQLVQANRYKIWVAQNPASFELLAKNNLGNKLGPIDFTNIRIICLAKEYSIDDKCLAVSLEAELWKYRMYENNMLVITREEDPEQLIIGSKSNKTVIQKIVRQPQPAKTIEEHLKGASPELKDAFRSIDKRIMNISTEVERYTTKAEIVYKTSRNFAYFAIQNRLNRIRCLLRTERDKIRDPKKLTTKIPKTHGYGHITRQLIISPKKLSENQYNIDNIVEILEQSYSCTQ